jgi:hypothetical protein
MTDKTEDLKATDDQKDSNVAPVGDSSATSGDDAKTPESDSYSKSFVDKLLSEKKNVSSTNQALQAEIESLRKQIKDRNESELKEQSKWKELYELEKEESGSWKSRFEDQHKTIEKGLKTRELRKELVKLGIDTTVIEKVDKLADFESIKVDPETKICIGADTQAKLIYDEWPKLFGNTAVGTNHDAPETAKRPITLEEWKKLPPEDKKKRKPDLFDSLGIPLKK